MKFLKITTQFSETIRELDDAEIGRLFSAMLSYARDGTELELSGCERLLWKGIRKEIDQQLNSYEKKVAAAAAAREHNPNNMGTDNSPQSIDISTQSTDISTQSTDISTQSTDNSPQSTDNSPQSTDNSPQSTDNSPQSTDNSPQSTDNSPQSTDISPHPTEISSSRGNDYQVINNNHLVTTEWFHCSETKCTERGKMKKIKALSDDNARNVEADSIISAWNRLGLSQVTKVSPSSSRGKMLQARITEYGAEEILKAIENVRQSRFLNGRNRSGWTITFDWFVRPENFLKVLEGNYTDTAVRGHSPPVNDDFDPNEIDRIQISR